MDELGTIYPAVGFSNQEGHVFLASNLSKVENHLDDEEINLVCKYLSLEEFSSLIKENVIKDKIYPNFTQS